MANPFHDDLGQFCSRNEMQAAINRLAEKGDLDGYFKLRLELEQIDNKKTEISENFLTRILDKTTPETAQNAEELEMYAKAWIDKVNATRGDYDEYDDNPLGSEFTSLYSNEFTSDEVKKQLVAELDDSLRYRILFEEHGSIRKLGREDVLDIVGDSRNEKVLIQSLRYSQLTLDDQYELSKRTPEGLYELAYRSVLKKEVLANPKIVEELEAKVYAQDPKVETRHSYRGLMAERSENQDIHNYILSSIDENTHKPSVELSYLLRNEKLSKENTLRVLETSRDYNLGRFRDVFSIYNEDKARQFTGKMTRITNENVLHRAIKSGRAPKELQQQLDSETNRNARVNLTAEIYSYADNRADAREQLTQFRTNPNLTKEESDNLMLLHVALNNGAERAVANKVIEDFKEGSNLLD